MTSEAITANLIGTARTETLNGREHLVVPMTLIVPGVLNGSKGPLFYPEDELKKSPEDWNGIPIVVYHPSKDGKPLSARQPSVYNASYVGTVFNAGFDSKLVAEGWFDIERTRRVDPRIISSIEAGTPIELSTGLRTEEVQQRGEFNGTTYNAVARNYKPDHLAVLPDMVGACSVRDGCGVLVNEVRRALAESDGVVDPDNVDVLNIGEDRMAKLTQAKRKEIIDDLIANCDCWEDDDRAMLEAMPDVKLNAASEQSLKLRQQQAVLNAAEKGFKAGNAEFKYDAEKGEFIVNETQPTKQETPPVTQNQEQPKPKTLNEWMAEAPAEVQEVVRNAQEREQREKDKAIEFIVANERNTFTKDELQAMKLPQLEKLAALAVKEEKVKPVHNYAGAAAGTTGGSAREEVETPLMLPTINWAEDK